MYFVLSLHDISIITITRASAGPSVQFKHSVCTFPPLRSLDPSLENCAAAAASCELQAGAVLHSRPSSSPPPHLSVRACARVLHRTRVVGKVWASSSHKLLPSHPWYPLSVSFDCPNNHKSYYWFSCTRRERRKIHMSSSIFIQYIQ